MSKVDREVVKKWLMISSIDHLSTTFDLFAHWVKRKIVFIKRRCITTENTISVAHWQRVEIFLTIFNNKASGECQQPQSKLCYRV